MIKKTIGGEDLGIKIGGECLHPVRFADDKTMPSNTAKGLKTLISKRIDATEDYGRKINTMETKVIVISWKENKKVKMGCETVLIAMKCYNRRWTM